MLRYLIARVVSSTGAFLYPAYASYKAIARRPSNELELERWLMYWSVVGVIVSVEYFAEWFVSWFPFYWELKTIFLLYLALPQTQGSTILYKTHLEPILTEYEPAIDAYLASLKTKLYNFVQSRLRTLWDAVINNGNPTGNAAAEAQGDPAAPPSLARPVGGAAQLALGLWATYGPTIIASGASILQPPAVPSARSSGYVVDSDATGGPQTRVRGAGARAAAGSSSESASEASAPPSPHVLASRGAPAAAHAPNRERDMSGPSDAEESDWGGDKSQYEKIRRDEAESDSEGTDSGHPAGPSATRPSAENRKSWFGGWGGAGTPQGRGYERVNQKND
ncbi:hypothetical protein BOTBODRAFT_39596 [Botryobasidium botryosum FD-172 SS1]|uniref:Protein YOP1 n=1 Tax=Botryobasidium botryosum (strain FD-172 SS1) TaxID=930990 RepID=A0A067LVZ0_BOTB1|nr:hypothetical protein BOTBODRAFT_39596 [Botryobasidium botryosum FD-172 SS1]